MGTRSTTKIYNSEKLLVTLYCQFDGYFDGVGKQLAEFLASRPLVNGISSTGPCFNGMGCLAAQLIAEFKDAPGLWYVSSPGAEDEEYNYQIRGDTMHPEKGILFLGEGHGESFEGKPSEFSAWMGTLEKAQ